MGVFYLSFFSLSSALRVPSFHVLPLSEAFVFCFLNLVKLPWCTWIIFFFSRNTRICVCICIHMYVFIYIHLSKVDLFGGWSCCFPYSYTPHSHCAHVVQSENNCFVYLVKNFKNLCGNAIPELSAPIWQRAAVSHLLVNMFQTSVNYQNSNCYFLFFIGILSIKLKKIRSSICRSYNDV